MFFSVKKYALNGSSLLEVQEEDQNKERSEQKIPHHVPESQ